MNRWDEYFLTICKAVAQKSSCLSIKRGAVLVSDNSIVATGYNGPARGVSHCGRERYEKDETLQAEMKASWDPFYIQRIVNECPRRILGFQSGEGLGLCPAAHSERNGIANAARLGVITKGCTMYMATQPPCKDCMVDLINAGVMHLVVANTKFYDPLSEFIAHEAGVKIRPFDLG